MDLSEVPQLSSEVKTWLADEERGLQLTPEQWAQINQEWAAVWRALAAYQQSPRRAPSNRIPHESQRPPARPTIDDRLFEDPAVYVPDL